METINDIIRNEFELNGYAPCNSDKLKPTESLYKHRQCCDYWLITSSIESYENQQEVFNAIQELENLNKNVSMLILHNETKKPIDEVGIENDSYFFKKYVLEFSDDSVSKLIAIMDQSGFSSIKDLVMMPASFERFGNEVESGPYTLLYAIIHKLPFIPIEVHNKDINFDRLEIIMDSDDFKLISDLSKDVDNMDDMQKAIDRYLEPKDNG
jgi:hypothetical protein